jgi:ABC-type oligopeptide transport system substrate-binding subunit
MKKKQIVSLVLTAAMGLSLCACGNSSSVSDSTQSGSAGVAVDGSTSAADAQTEVDLAAYGEDSAELYSSELGEFESYYAEAFEAETVAERFALMAIAEAKLMESAVLLPMYTQGGYYAISRVAPYTVDYSMWGNDNDRYHQAIITTEFITAEDRAEMKEKWSELKGTGTYEEWAKEYLTGKGYEFTDTYGLTYSTDPATWDALATSRASDSEAIVNTYDGLLEYDVEGTLQPALAESYEVSEDGLTYTFYLRQGVKWVDSQGREVADVVADDFVAGLQHMMDAQGGLEYLIEGIIVNASEYISGEVTDFSEVGVTAVDDYTLQYTLEAPCSYFTTMLGYNLFAPMSRTYYVSMGGKFGYEYDPSASDYLYGLDSDSIAYCGPYLVTNHTDKSVIVFSANESYWNADNINVKTIKWQYNDGTDPTKTYEMAKSGDIAGVSLTDSTLESAKSEGLFDIYAYASATDATTFSTFLNFNRTAFANANDATTVISPQTVDDAARTKAAMQNVHFRRAVCFAIDRGAYAAQSKGEDLKYNGLRNSYTPGVFVSLPEEVTVDINGTATTFAEGTYYGEIMQAQIDADDVAIKVWDPDGDDGIGSSDGYDGWYNADNAVAELEEAIAELSEQGVEISAENPIYLDLPTASFSEIYNNQAQALKQSVENALGGAVIVNLTECADWDQWYYAGYYTDYGYEANYDLYDLSGWGPDYGDPSTYLDTMASEYAGYMTKCIGIY